jgi:hypothetical protein
MRTTFAVLAVLLLSAAVARAQPAPVSKVVAGADKAKGQVEQGIPIPLASGGGTSELQPASGGGASVLQSVKPRSYEGDPTDYLWIVLGLKVEKAAESAVTKANKDLRGGVTVIDVRRDGPAAAVLQRGDILVGLEVWETLDTQACAFVLLRCQAQRSKSVKYHVVRNAKLFTGSTALHFPQPVDANVGLSPSKGTKVGRLLEERLAILKELDYATEKAFQANKATFAELVEAKSLLLGAEMALCEGDQERLKVHEKSVAFAREFEQRALQLHGKGLLPGTAVMLATSKRLEAEIALERALNGTSNRDYPLEKDNRDYPLEKDKRSVPVATKGKPLQPRSGSEGEPGGSDATKNNPLRPGPKGEEKPGVLYAPKNYPLRPGAGGEEKPGVLYAPKNYPLRPGVEGGDSKAGGPDAPKNNPLRPGVEGGDSKAGGPDAPKNTPLRPGVEGGDSKAGGPDAPKYNPLRPGADVFGKPGGPDTPKNNPLRPGADVFGKPGGPNAPKEDGRKKPATKHDFTSLQRLATALENYNYPENSATRITVWCQGGGKGNSVQVTDAKTLDVATACHYIVDGHHDKKGLDLENVAIMGADGQTIRFVNIKEKFAANKPFGLNVNRGEVVIVLQLRTPAEPILPGGDESSKQPPPPPRETAAECNPGPPHRRSRLYRLWPAIPTPSRFNFPGSALAGNRARRFNRGPMATYLPPQNPRVGSQVPRNRRLQPSSLWLGTSRRLPRNPSTKTSLGMRYWSSG